MTLSQLRELATCRGLPENGMKKQLIERLAEDMEKSEDNTEGIIFFFYVNSRTMLVLTFCL